MEHLCEKHPVNRVPYTCSTTPLYSEYRYKLLDTPSMFYVIRSSARDEQMDNIETLIDKRFMIRTE